MDWMEYAIWIFIFVLVNGLAWLFGVDGRKIAAWWIWVVCVILIFYIIGYIIVIGMKAAGLGICP